MAYGFIKQSRGHISVCSELGKGTTFRLYLPSAEKIDTELKAASVTEVTLGRASGEVILAVDDNSAVRTTTAKQLRDLGYQVLEAENAQSALDTLDAVPRIDLLFTRWGRRQRTRQAGPEETSKSQSIVYVGLSRRSLGQLR
jgi:PleD family two-component response regulator